MSAARLPSIRYQPPSPKGDTFIIVCYFPPPATMIPTRTWHRQQAHSTGKSTMHRSWHYQVANGARTWMGQSPFLSTAAPFNVLVCFSFGERGEGRQPLAERSPCMYVHMYLYAPMFLYLALSIQCIIRFGFKIPVFKINVYYAPPQQSIFYI